ncbi:hypothetical protein K7X08_010315 [Anisodus acutangulus]|uniref:Uncharacterized protein n=1 Tax=Anisodus acutangulus TaxID=402998 RepID=A0A9Q1N6Y9_9SOLA|nr:hypothetical protein K7X08_010315 [Anisodus acutangulus]
MIVLVIEKNASKVNDLSDEEDTQHASKAPSKLEEKDTQSEDIGGIGSQAPVQKFGIIKAPTPVAILTTHVKKPRNIFPVPTAEVEAKGVPAQVDENVVLTGEPEKAKDKPAKVVEYASESSQADIEFDSEKIAMGVIAQINDSENN